MAETLTRKGRTYTLVYWSGLQTIAEEDKFARIRWWHQNVKPWMDKNMKDDWFWIKHQSKFAFASTNDAILFKLAFHATT